jgi:hypothetical protein
LFTEYGSTSALGSYDVNDDGIPNLQKELEMRPKKLCLHSVLFYFIFTGLSLSPAHCDSLDHAIGGGFGLPYGGVGVNYELGVNEFIAPTFGVGLVPDNLGWNAGVRAYYPGRDYIVRGRLTLLYGTNVILEKEGVSGGDEETDTGLSLGVGVDWRFGEDWGVSADLFVADTDTPRGYEKVDNDIFMALGVSYHW